MIKPWQWREDESHVPRPRVLKAWDLFDGRGRHRASIWQNSGNEFTWHTYDENGTGGENSEAASLDDAKRAVVASVVVQGWAPGGWSVQW